MSVDKAKAWSDWTDSLTGAARRALDPSPVPVVAGARNVPDDEHVDSFVDMCSTLTPACREKLSSLGKTVPSVEELTDMTLARYCLLESTDGEWPTLRVFKSSEGLARRIGVLEGTDTVAWPLFGLPLQFTRGPQRYLLLPDGSTAIQIPMFEGGPCKKLSADLVESLEIQEDSFVGPPELVNPALIDDKLKSCEVSAHGDTDDDDDDEDEDEDSDGAAVD